MPPGAASVEESPRLRGALARPRVAGVPGSLCPLPPAVASYTTPRLQRTKMDSEEETGIRVPAPRGIPGDGEVKKNPRPV